MSETKVCTKCGVEKAITEYYSGPSYKDGKNTKCKKCATEYSKEYKAKNKAKTKQQNRKFREKNRDKLKGKSRSRHRKNINCLGDQYVKSKISRESRIKFKDIPPELVELKRLQLAINRELKGKTL